MPASWSAASISPALPCSAMSRPSNLSSPPPDRRSTMSERPLRIPLPAAPWLVIAAWLAAATAAAQEPHRPLDLASFPRTTLEISHHGAGHDAHLYRFEVWVAGTPERAGPGLMFVSDLPESQG